MGKLINYAILGAALVGIAGKTITCNSDYGKATQNPPQIPQQYDNEGIIPFGESHPPYIPLQRPSDEEEQGLPKRLSV